MIWLRLGDLQFYAAGSPDDAMDRKSPRLRYLTGVGELDFGNGRITNIRATLSTAAVPEIDPPPISAALYDGESLLFEGAVDTISIGGGGVEVTAIA